MIPEEAQALVTEIWNSLPESEQERLLVFFRSPKLEPFREGKAVKVTSFSGPAPDSGNLVRTHAVGK